MTQQLDSINWTWKIQFSIIFHIERERNIWFKRNSLPMGYHYEYRIFPKTHELPKLMYSSYRTFWYKRERCNGCLFWQWFKSTCNISSKILNNCQETLSFSNYTFYSSKSKQITHLSRTNICITCLYTFSWIRRRRFLKIMNDCFLRILSTSYLYYHHYFSCRIISEYRIDNIIKCC